MSLEPNQVQGTAKIDDDAFVGDQSQVEVRMLTVVGGYYVNVTSMGNDPLGANDSARPRDYALQPDSHAHRHDEDHRERQHAADQRVTEQFAKGLAGTNVEVVAINRCRQCLDVDDRPPTRTGDDDLGYV